MGEDLGPREHLLQVAGRVFSERGFRDATVREICGAAGVNVAAVNYYFGDKETLYHEAVRHALRLIESQSPMPEAEASGQAEGRLYLHIQTMLRRLLGSGTQPWQTRLIFREIMDPTQVCEEMVREFFEPHFRRLLEILREVAPPGTTTEQLERFGFSVVGQCTFYRSHHEIVELLTGCQAGSDPFDARMLAEHITRFTLSGIRNFQLQDQCSQFAWQPAARPSRRETAE